MLAAREPTDGFLNSGASDATEPLAHQDGVPLYIQLKNILSARLHDGRWMPGEQLPTEPQLSRQFGVSEGTVRQAVMALVKEGQLTRRSGKGTFVAKRRLEESFARFFRFRTDGRGPEQAFQIDVRKWTVERLDDEEVMSALKLKKSAAVLCIHRSIGQGTSTICHYRSFLPYRQFKGMEHEELRDQALYDVLQDKYNVHIVRATEVLHARHADSLDAEILGVKQGEPVISINRTAYTYRNRAVEFRRTTGRSDKFFYEIELK